MMGYQSLYKRNEALVRMAAISFPKLWKLTKGPTIIHRVCVKANSRISFSTVGFVGFIFTLIELLSPQSYSILENQAPHKTMSSRENWGEIALEVTGWRGLPEDLSLEHHPYSNQASPEAPF